jgi:hypothetical protein
MFLKMYKYFREIYINIHKIRCLGFAQNIWGRRAVESCVDETPE